MANDLSNFPPFLVIIGPVGGAARRRRESWNDLLLAAAPEVRGQRQLWVLGVHVYGGWGSTVEGRGARTRTVEGRCLFRKDHLHRGCKERERENGGRRMTHVRERRK